MPEKTSDKTIFSLSEVTLSIQRALADRYPSAFWVKAEMNKLNRYPHSGHCYPDLVEKINGKIVAEMRATIWKDDFDAINARFIQVLREPLKDGITILFLARITYHPVYGLSLRITDIDPSFSLGELERDKQETIRRLMREGIFAINKSKTIPVLPSRIAVISVQTSKGYADFTKIITENPWNYRIFHMLFPALLQGENAVGSILYQLGRIEKVMHHFDAVAIIRGGGGDVGLTCYNHYTLARSIALFPLPVLTGIGHSTNETVAEMVACKNAITPTELADFLIQKYHNFAVPVNRALEQIRVLPAARIREEKEMILHQARLLKAVSVSGLEKHYRRMHLLSSRLVRQSTWFLENVAGKQIMQNLRRFSSGIRVLLNSRRAEIRMSGIQLTSGTTRLLTGSRQRMEHLSKLIIVMDPVHVLRRGYSLTYAGGKLLKQTTDVKTGETMTTLLHDGRITSQIQTIEKNSSDEQTTQLYGSI